MVALVHVTGLLLTEAVNGLVILEDEALADLVGLLGYLDHAAAAAAHARGPLALHGRAVAVGSGRERILHELPGGIGHGEELHAVVLLGEKMLAGRGLEVDPARLGVKRHLQSGRLCGHDSTGIAVSEVYLLGRLDDREALLVELRARGALQHTDDLGGIEGNGDVDVVYSRLETGGRLADLGERNDAGKRHDQGCKDSFHCLKGLC